LISQFTKRRDEEKQLKIFEAQIESKKKKQKKKYKIQKSPKK
jgi:hypothetical protein